MYTAAELTSLLKLCRKLGATSFKAGPVEVQFVPKDQKAHYTQKSQKPVISHTQELAEELQNARDWMSMDFPPPAMPQEDVD